MSLALSSSGLYGQQLSLVVSNTGFGDNSQTIDFTVVPEPATLALLGFGAIATLIRRKK